MINSLSTSEKLTILALDDDPFILRILRQALPPDMNLVTVQTCDEFRMIQKETGAHIVLLDLVLPDGNGIDITRELRADPRNREIFIILLTGSTDQETIENGYAEGADDFIRKPFIPSELTAKMRMFERIIRARSGLRSAYRSQVDYNRKLYSLSALVEKNLKTRDILTSFRTAEYLYEIIDSTYIELIVQVEGARTSLVRKSILSEDSLSRPGFRTFEELERAGAIKPRAGEGIRSFRIRTGQRVIHCCLCTLLLSSRDRGYILLEGERPLSAEDREILSLFTDFFSLLSNRFRIEKVIEDMNREFKSEISKIRKIQVSLLPDFTTLPGYDISATYLPAQDLSGDFFDAFYLDDNTYQIILCDVAGHGISSSYVGNEIRTLFRIASRPGRDPAIIAKEVNDRLTRDMEGMAYYCTAIVLQIDVSRGTLLYLNAGHPSALFCRSGEKSCSLIEQTGPIIGLFPDNEYEQKQLMMSEGDSLLLYTDGLTEAHNEEHGDMFGESRLLGLFDSLHGRSSRDINHFLVGSLYEFVDYADQMDDITILCIRRDPSIGEVTLF